MFLIAQIAIELLNDDYIYTKKLKLTTKTDDGVTYAVSGSQTSKSDVIDAELSAKANFKGVTVTTKAFTSGKLPTAEFKYETIDDQGRKATIVSDVGQEIRNGSVEFQGGPVGLKVGVDGINSDLYGCIAVALTPVKYAGYVVVGAEGQYSIGSKELTKQNFALSYFDGRESEVSLHLLDKMKFGMISYSHRVREGFSVGAQMTKKIDHAEPVPAKLTFGTAYSLDGATTVKCKIDSEGMLALSYIQDVRSNAKLIMSSMFDVNKLEASKLGLSLAIE